MVIHAFHLLLKMKPLWVASESWQFGKWLELER